MIISYTLNPVVATGVTLTPSVSSPQFIGTSINFTAVGSGGSGSYNYEFYYQAPGTTTWVKAQAYSSSATWAWNTAGLAAGTYNIGVWVKVAGSTPAAGYDKVSIISFTVSSPAATGMTFTPSLASPQPVGANVTFTAVGSGGSGSYNYEFYYQAPNSTTWVKAQPYSNTATWTWNTTGLAKGKYQIGAWVKASGTSPAPGYDKYVIIPFTLF